MSETENNIEITKPFKKRRNPLVYGILLMVLSSVCVCFGQTFWKLGGKEDIFLLLIGFVLYIAGAFAMIIAYRFGKLSQLQPILSLNYALGIIIAWLIFDEKISLSKIIAIAMITAGVILIAYVKKERI